MASNQSPLMPNMNLTNKINEYGASIESPPLKSSANSLINNKDFNALTEKIQNIDGFYQKK